MSERMRDLRAPLVVAIVVVAAMFAAFTVTRSNAATETPQSAAPNQTIQSAPEQAPDKDDCPEKDGRGGGRGQGGPGEQGSSTAPAPQPSAPTTTDGTDL